MINLLGYEPLSGECLYSIDGKKFTISYPYTERFIATVDKQIDISQFVEDKAQFGNIESMVKYIKIVFINDKFQNDKLVNTQKLLKKINEFASNEIYKQEDNANSFSPLENVAKHNSIKVFAKVDCLKPFDSVIDRVIDYMLDQAELRGELRPNYTIISKTDSDFGYKLTQKGTIRGYSTILAVSSKTSQDRINKFRTFGATVYVCPAHVPSDDPRSYHMVAKRLYEHMADTYYFDKNKNVDYAVGHYQITGPEIWNKTKGKLTHFICNVNTGGTISGAGRFLKEKNPKIKIIGVDAYGSVLKKYFETGILDTDEIYPYRIENLGSNKISANLDKNIIDHFEKVTDQESAKAAREIVSKHGLFIGYVSGAVFQAYEQIKDEFNYKSYVVLNFPDDGSDFMSKIYSDEWMEDQGFFEKIESKAPDFKIY